MTTSLTKATTGPLAGFTVLPLDEGCFQAYLKQTLGQSIAYGFGAKDPDVGTLPPRFSAIDCSGYVRSLLAYATHGATLSAAMPDGSYNEGDWCVSQGFKPTDYTNCALSDGHLRIAFHSPNGRGGDAIGHVWLVRNGFSIESYGGNGPGRRSWAHDWFVQHVDRCFVLC